MQNYKQKGKQMYVKTPVYLQYSSEIPIFQA